MIALWFFYVWIMIEIFKVSRGSFLATIISYRATSSNSKSGLRANQQEQAQAQGPGQGPGHDSNQTVQVESDGSENVRSGSSQISMIERQLITKICMYMLGCFFQYSPGTPYAISFLFPSQPFVLYIMAIISINLGGVVNATALILNEGIGRMAKSRDEQSTSYFPSSTMPEGSSSIGVQRYRADMPLDTASWGQVPSFAGILVNPHAKPDAPGLHPLYTAESQKPHTQIQSLYANPAIAPRTDYDAIWEVGPGRSPYHPGSIQTPATTRAYPPVPPIPNQYQQPSVTVTRSGSVSRRSSEHSNAPTMVNIGSSELSQAYAIMARHQQERQSK
ncbi:hypothetical protein BJ742DRAFT_219723 [Cladochytrium replicatum]|nr:hypothetical protein BJ742DRAFT_219723 [Cladochytrium replicatum]